MSPARENSDQLEHLDGVLMPSQILQIQLSLKGRAIKTYSFSDDEVTVGRDPDSQIALDNPGVSRAHASS